MIENIINPTNFYMDDGDVASLIKYMSLVSSQKYEFKWRFYLVSSCSFNKDFLNRTQRWGYNL